MNDKELRQNVIEPIASQADIQERIAGALRRHAAVEDRLRIV